MPPPPEKAEKEQVKPEDAGQQLRAEVYQPKEVTRVGDQGDKPKDAGQTYQTVFTELKAAKEGMIGVTDIVAKGGGPKGSNDGGSEAYQKALESAQQHYNSARLAADKFLFVCDEQGNPRRDSTGNPIPSKENIQLRQQLAQMEQGMQQMSQDKTPEGQKKLRETLESTNQIKDLLRSSGYARANNALALMFHSADLQGENRANFAKAGMALVNKAAEFDPAMSGDANFQRHYEAAMNAVIGGGKPGDQQQPPKGDQQQPPKGDQQQPPQGDQQQPPKGDQQQPPKGDQQQPPKGDQQQPPMGDGRVDVPGSTAKVGVENNQYYLDFRGKHLPTWTQQNPDGSASKPFTMSRDVKQTDGTTKQEQYVRADGILKPVQNKDGAILGMDGEPLTDAKGIRRLGPDGTPVPAMFDGSDPAMMQAQLDNAMKGKPLDDNSRGLYNTVIESADKLDRVSLAKVMDSNDQLIAKNPEAKRWLDEYAALSKKNDAAFNDLASLKDKLQPNQVDALQKMWEGVKKPQDLDPWLNKPENKAAKDLLTADPAKWAEIKTKYNNYLGTEAELIAKETERDKKAGLTDAVRTVANADAMNRELSRIMMSSVTARGVYLNKLLEDQNVKAYGAVADKSSPDAKKLENDKSVAEARRMVAELAKADASLVPALADVAKGLGVDLSKVAAPKETTPNPQQDQAQPPKDQTQQPPKDQTQEPPKDQTQQPPKDQTQLPKDQTQPAKDPAAKPADGELTAEQAQSPSVLNDAYMSYLKATEQASKPMKTEDFDKLLPVWEKALEANASIKKELIAASEQQAQDTLANQMALIVALQKTGKTKLEDLKPEDLQKVTREDLQAAMSSAVQNWAKVNSDLNAAVNGLNPDNAKKYMDAEKKFAASMEQAQKDAGSDQTKLQAAYTAALNAKIAEQKAIDPKLASAIDARMNLIGKPEGMFAKTYADTMQGIDNFKHVDEARLQLAQALALQGGDANKAKAAALVTKAMENPDAAALLQATSDGQKLLSDLKLKTPQMSKLQDEQDKLFPELKLTKQAMDLMADKTKDPKEQWKQADALFKQAEASIEAEIMQRGQGKTVAESLQRVNENVESMKSQLMMSLDNFKNDRTKLPGPDGPEKDKDAKIVKDLMSRTDKDHPNGMTPNEMLDALLGQTGKPASPETQQLQLAMQRVLTDADRGTLNALAILQQKSEGVAWIRMQHALKASEYGFAVGDETAKKQGKELVESIATVDPRTFSQSPEVLGALKQAEQGKQIETANGKAAAVAFSESAKDTISKTQTGLVDAFIPGASMTGNLLAVKTTGHYISEVPLVGGLFGGSKEASDKLIQQLAWAQLSNPAEAKAQRDQTVNDGNNQIRGLLGDVAGVGSSFLTGYGVNMGLNGLTNYLEKAPMPLWAKVPIVAGSALVVGGATNNAVSGHDLLASRGYIRNTVATGTTYAAIKGIEYLPMNRPLSAETLSKFGTGVPEGLTGAQLGKELTALSAETAKKGWLVSLAEAAPSRLNPLTYTPFRYAPATGQGWKLWQGFQYAGFGGERTAQLLGSGAMNLVEYNSRQFAAKTMGLFAAGYGYGALNKGAAIYTGEHLDGKKYSTINDYLTDMNKAGIQTGLVSSIVIPIGAKMMVPQSWQNGVSKGVNNMFSRLPGVDAAYATTSMGSAALMFARPTMDASSRFGEASIYDTMYQAASKRVAEVNGKAAQVAEDMKKQQQQQ